jgi:hypothetical protein
MALCFLFGLTSIQAQSFEHTTPAVDIQAISNCTPLLSSLFW